MKVSVMCAPHSQGQELLANAGVVADRAAKRRRDGPAAGLADAAKRHAHVLRLEEDADAARAQLGLQPVGDLRRQTLLDLQVACEQLYDPRKFAQSEDPLTGQVSDVRDAVERQ